MLREEKMNIPKLLTYCLHIPMLLLQECAAMPAGDGEQGLVHASHARCQLSDTPLASSLKSFQIICYGQDRQEICPAVSQVGEDSTLKMLKITMHLFATTCY